MTRRSLRVQRQPGRPSAANLWSSSGYAKMLAMFRGVAVALLVRLLSSSLLGSSLLGSSLLGSSLLGSSLLGCSLLGCSTREAGPVEPDAAPALSRAEPAPSAAGGAAGDAGAATNTPQGFRLPLPDPRSVKQSAATRHATLSAAKCRAELKKRSIDTKPAGLSTPGVATPLRLADSVQGIQFVAPGGKSKFGVLDCRLALALEELARVLERHRVSAVLVDNFYRPHARMSGTAKPSQHAHGLAIDIMGFKLADGRTLVIKKDWHGALSAPVCGPESQPVESTPEAIALWNMVCEIARERIFHHMLTPNNDAAHADHLHFDIKRDARSFLVR